ncbi:protein serine/threonine phosphatase 2C [Piedraia hortae CBS 480.64]|uniref:Protein serine/threonine phosphatase 2C n=1 Tax=Piedraia hortae CBS 480.64 TaxID=1314780 RepID=A0A6A7C8V5_9PEZI|nr:protein serine/threonine phosphatase 2C [Piedraia hortae CBS 480.64]
MYLPLGIGAAAAALYFGLQRTTPGLTSLKPQTTAAETPEFGRKALVVDRDQFLVADVPGDQPINKDTDFSRRKLLEMLTPEQASAKLRTNQESYLVSRGAGVVRYDVVQIPSNDPIEDDHVEKIVEMPGQSDWMFWGVFDGHSGWTTSAKLRQALVSYVARELNNTYQAVATPSAEAVDAAIKQGFLKLDYEITHEAAQKVMDAQSKVVAAQMLAPALSGSCALLSFYDSRSKELRVACAGDSRAVLGRRTASGKWTATPLSVDLTGGTPSEDARLRAEHPGEPYVTHNGRILGGLEPSRAFGDAMYKWSRGVQEKLRSKYFGRTPPPHLRTPPYVTAEPVITTTKMDPSKNDFVVMATDGLWEMLSNDEVVGLVGQWLETQGMVSTPSSWVPSWLRGKSTSLPLEPSNTGEQGGQRIPIRQRQWNVPSDTGRFVVQDANAATHLVRNALGGRDGEMLSALLTLPSPQSRRWRDDLTVQVIFFGEGEANGSVEINHEASATTKAKL